MGRGFTSRGGWNINICMRGDCIYNSENLDNKKCNSCIRFSEYKKGEVCPTSQKRKEKD